MKQPMRLKVAIVAAFCAVATSLMAASYSLQIEDGILTGYSGKLPASLVIPDEVTGIERYALESSTLKNVTIPASVQWIDSPAFEGVQNFSVAEGSEYYSAVDGVLFSYDGTALVAYPDGRSATSYEIPDGVTSIDAYAISGSAPLKSLTVPATLDVEGISPWAFDDCKIQTLSVAGGDDSGAYLKSVDGILFSADGTVLVRCPAGKSGVYVIPEDVTEIAAGAFNRCELLTSVTIPEGVTIIGDFAFENCKLLSSMTLPSSLEELGGKYVRPVYTEDGEEILIPYCVFRGCTKLKQILVPEDCAALSVGLDEPEGCHKFVVVPSLWVDEPNSYYSVGEEFVLEIGTSEEATVKVTGLPSGMSLVSDDGYYSISGAPTKAGLSTVTITATKDGASNTKTIQINVGMQQLVLKTTEGSVGMKSLTGAGYYAAGKTATLKATAATGYVFAGWYTDDDGIGNYRECDFGATDYRSASASYQIPSEDDWDPSEPITLYAKFISEEDDIYLWAETADGEGLYGQTLTVEDDGSLECAITVNSLSAPTMKMTGLPKGLTFNAKTGVISGKSTTPGIYDVTLTLSNASLTGEKFEFSIYVPNLDSDYIYLTYDGEEWEKDNVVDLVAGMALSSDDMTVDAIEDYTMKVSGLPAGLTYNAKTGRITGKPTKVGTYTVTFTATKGKVTGTSTRSIRVSGRYVEVVSLSEGEDEEDGAKSLSGDGEYAVGAKVALKAVAKTGYVFAGWYRAIYVGTDDSGYGDWDYEPYTDLGVDYRTASVSWTVPDPQTVPDEDLCFYAKFVSAEKDAEALKAFIDDEAVDGATFTVDGTWDYDFAVESASIPTVKMTGLPKGLTFDSKKLLISGCPTVPGTYSVTVTLSNTSIKNKTEKFTIVVPNITSDYIKIEGLDDYGWDADTPFPYTLGVPTANYAADCWSLANLAITAEKGWTLTATGLPAGLKFDAKTGEISGTPTKAGTYTVTFTAKQGKSIETTTRTFVVEALPAKVVGTFNGTLCDGDGLNAGTFTLTATDAGKITAKVVDANGTYSFSGSWLYNPCTFNGYSFAVDSTKGKSTETSTRTFVVSTLPAKVVGTFTGTLCNGDGLNVGTFTLTATDAGKITAKVTTATGTSSFSGSWLYNPCTPNGYSFAVDTMKGETLFAKVNLGADWNTDSMSGSFYNPKDDVEYSVSARKNPLADKWYLAAEADGNGSWAFTFVDTAKEANLTVTPKGDGTVAIAGKIGTYSVSASSILSFDQLADGNGMFTANFVSFVTVGKTKQALSINCELWFNHPAGDYAGSAKLVD